MHRTIALLVMVVLVAACTRVPITGRKQLNLLPESEMMSMSLDAYKDFLQKTPPLPANDERVVMVRGIGRRLADAATKYLSENGAADRVAGFAWEFNVVEENTVNAWCMPGGK